MLKDRLHPCKIQFEKVYLIFQHFSGKFDVLELLQVDDLFKNFVKNL
jgi:hypothetical protein